MRKKKMNALKGILCLSVALLLGACSEDEVVRLYPKVYKSMFTVKVDENSYHFESDKGKIFSSVHPIKGYNPQKEHRAFVYYEVALERDCETCDYPIYAHRIDTVLSKSLAENLEEENETVYGNDPVEIDKIFISGGYLNIRFGTYWGGQKAHFVNLVCEKEDEPYSVRFRHNAYDDPKRYPGYGWVAFDLSELISGETEDAEIKLEVEVQTYNGLKTHTLTLKNETEEIEETDGIEETEPPSFLLK